jgi:hypothetical protein
MTNEYDKDIIRIDSTDYKVIQKYFLDLYISCNDYKKTNPTKKYSIDCSPYYKNFVFYSQKTNTV